MSNINPDSLPFDSEGRANSLYVAPEVEPKEVDVFSRLGPTRNSNPPIYIRYKNYYTLGHGSAELPEAPIKTALNNDRPLVIYYVNDNGQVWATRLDDESDIKHACIGKRFMPHFPAATLAMRSLNPDGFNMIVMRLELNQFVKLEDYPDEATKLKLYRKTKYLTKNK